MATIKDIQDYLGCTVAELRSLTPEDRDELKASYDALMLEPNN